MKPSPSGGLSPIGGQGGGNGDPPPNRHGSGENQARGPGGNGIGGPRRRKIGMIRGPTVGRGSAIRKNFDTGSLLQNFYEF